MGYDIGDKIRFIPDAFMHYRLDGAFAPVSVTGSIEYINRVHRYYRVRFEVNGYTLYECFKF